MIDEVFGEAYMTKLSTQTPLEVLEDHKDVRSRTVYWAAQGTDMDMVRMAIEQLKISPTTKCIDGRNLFMAAAIGN